MGAAQTFIMRSPLSEFPNKPYKPLPHSRKKGTGELIAKFPAVPPQLILPSDGQMNAYYWWCECQFVPYDDTSLIVTNTCFVPRPLLTWIPCFKIIKGPGNLFKYDISSETIKCQPLRGKITGTYPSVQIHPNGECVCILMVDKIIISEISTNKTLFQSPVVLGIGAIKYCTFSSDGNYIAVLSRQGCDYIVTIHMMSITMVSSGKVICNHVCKGFKGNRSYNDSARCRFSPCNSYLAISSSLGKLFILNLKKMENICTVFPELLPDPHLSTMNSYDMHPAQPGHLTVGSSDDTLYYINFESKKILEEIELGDTIDCVKYSPSGSLLAVALREFIIHLFDTSSNTIFRTIDMKDVLGNSMSNRRFSYCYTTQMSFNQTGEVLAVSSGDGEIKLYQITSNVDSLQMLCKRVMLSVIPLKKLKKLHVPKKIRNFLLVKALC